MKRFLSLVAVAALVTVPLVLSGGAASAAPAPPTFTVSPNPVLSGTTITFSGTGCLPRPGDEPGYPQAVISMVDDQPPIEASSAAVSPAVASLPSARAGIARLASEGGVKPFADDGDLIATPKANGTWSVQIDVPDYTIGDFTFGAVCDHYTDSFSYAPVLLTVELNPNSPVLIVLPDFINDDPSKAPELSTGVTYEVIAIGFRPGEKVQVVLHSEPVVLTTMTADDEYGVVDGSFRLPDDTVGGAHTLSLVGLSSGKNGSLPITVRANAVTTVTATAVATVTVPVPSTSVVATTTQAVAAGTTAAAPTLAATGTAASQMGWVGVALTLLGGATLLVARRRSPRLH